MVWPDLPLAACMVLTLCAVAEVQFAGSAHDDNATGVAMNIAATAPLVLSRRYLAWVAIVVCSATGGLLSLFGTVTVTGMIGQLTVVYLVAARLSRRACALALLPLAGNVVYPYSGDDAGRLRGLLLLCAGLAVAALGDARRLRSRIIAEGAATRMEMAEVRRDQAVLQERSRIARELHDVVAHHVSMMVVQAETARVGTQGLPPAGQESLAAIGATGRQALIEMRRLLGVLRTAGDQRPTRQPQPGLDRLDELIAGARAAGNDVRLRRQGQPRTLPAGVELYAYRIIQEALTNVRRHAPGATVNVLVHYTYRALQVRVHNDCPNPRLAGQDGHGLLGMRERATMIGGTLNAGPDNNGGFLVEAELPADGTP